MPYDDVPDAHAEDTPDTPTIETLVDHLNERFPRDDRPWTAADTLKNVLVVLRHGDGTREPLAIGVPGDRDVDLKRLGGQLEPIEVEAMDEVEMKNHPALVKGYIGPGALGEGSESKIRYVVDPRVVDGTRWVTGANVAGQHVIDLVAGRDFTARRDDRARPTCATVIRARRARPDARVGPRHRDGPHLPARPQVLRRPRPEGARRERQAGHGRRWAPTASVPPGPWPRSPRTPSTRSACAGRERWRPPTCTSSRPARTRRSSPPPTRIAHELSGSGVEVLYDDRAKVSPGVKFKDAELIGVPTIVVVGKGLADGTVEVKDRRTGEREDVPADRVVDHVVGLVRA